MDKFRRRAAAPIGRWLWPLGAVLFPLLTVVQLLNHHRHVAQPVALSVLFAALWVTRVRGERASADPSSRRRRG